jgi:plastocyanin
VGTPTAFAYPVETATPASSAGPITIIYQDFEILPASTTLKVGTVVTFLIKGSKHQPYNFTAPNTFEAPPNLSDGASYTYTFAEAGTTTILCGYHRDMQATVVVEP